jgi:hypothetical protein
MPQTIRGKTHGRTIELDQDPEIPNGQEVQVTVRAIPSVAGAKTLGEGIRQSAGPLWRPRRGERRQSPRGCKMNPRYPNTSFPRAVAGTTRKTMDANWTGPMMNRRTTDD